jgi:hypothetical protein
VRAKSCCRRTDGPKFLFAVVVANFYINPMASAEVGEVEKYHAPGSFLGGNDVANTKTCKVTMYI